VSRSDSESGENKMRAWKFPSPTCPTIVDMSPEAAMSFLVSKTSSGSLDTGTLRSRFGYELNYQKRVEIEY